MITTDMQCTVNNIGRVVIPASLRRKFDICGDSAIEIFVKDGSIHLQKIAPACALCHSKIKLRTFKNKHVCSRCLDELI